jgi:hypothetical protein
VQSHPLLDNRVDWDKRNATDTKKKANPNLISGSNLADLVRPFALGHPVGRVAPGRNEQLAAREQPITVHVMRFLTALAEAFLEFAISGEDGSPEIPAHEVRETSLLGSPQHAARGPNTHVGSLQRWVAGGLANLEMVPVNRPCLNCPGAVCLPTATLNRSMTMVRESSTYVLRRPHPSHQTIQPLLALGACCSASQAVY